MFKLTRDKVGGIVLALSGYVLCLVVVWSIEPRVAEDTFRVTAAVGGFAAVVFGVAVAVAGN